MQTFTPAGIKRAVVRVAAGVTAAIVVAAVLLAVLWRDRESVDDIPLEVFPQRAADEPAVTVTWFGVTTLLFDDGETQILIDGFISRPGLLDVLARRPIDNDAATINFFLNEYRVRRLAAIIPVHSHFDHAMDIGALANRSSASVLGSATTANIARGAGVPEDQIVVVDDGAEYGFGQFSVRFIESAHAPVGWRGSVPLPGVLEEPLTLPAAVTAFPEGGSYSLVIAHPQGSTLVQGSAGIRDSALDAFPVDVVMLGVGRLGKLGREYLNDYWLATVTATGAKTAVAVHFDDFTKPFGSVELTPRFIDDFRETVTILRDLRDTWDTDTGLYLPEFAVPMSIYPRPDPEV